MMALSTTVHPTFGYIRIRVPQHYNRQPIVSRLISRYDLTVNIAGAFLEADTRDDGWFNLELQGVAQQIEAGLNYLQELNVEIVQLNIESLTTKSLETLHLLCVDGKDKVDAQEPSVALSNCAEQRFVGYHKECKKSSHHLQDNEEVDLTVVAGQTNRAKFQVCIPQNYRSTPVLAGLVSCYGLTVNITAASLDTKAKKDGWFDLEIWGSRQQITSGLRYLKKLGLQIWL